MQDLLFALRMARKNPGTTLAAFLALTLGIGATIAIFSVVSGVILRPLPFKDGIRLVRIFATDSTSSVNNVSMADYLDWKKSLRSFSGLALYGITQATLTGQATPERVIIGQAEWTFLPLLGVNPAAGRGFRAEENQPGQNGVAMVSWPFWQSHYGKQNVAGKTLTLDEKRYTLIGVLPQNVTVLGRADVWVPVVFDPAALENRRGNHSYTVFGRLKRGVSIAQANAELASFCASLAVEYPDDNKGVSATAVSLADCLIGNAEVTPQTNLRPTLLMLFGAVFCVLLIACGNVANINLARAWSRQREIAVRVAVGASRGRLFRQTLTESLLLSVSAALAGLALAVAAIRIFKSLPLTNIPRLNEIAIDWRVLLFTLVAALGTGVGFGLLPAMRAGTIHLPDVLKQNGGRTTASGRQQGLRRFFVGLETALAALLLIESGLLVKSFIKASRVNLALRTDHLLTVYISLPNSRYGYRHPGAIGPFVTNVLDRLKAVPGTESAAISSDLPLIGGGGGGGIVVKGQPLVKNPLNSQFALWTFISPSYFQTLGIRMVAGSGFTDDSAVRLRFVVVNQALVHRFLKRQNPIGQSISIAGIVPEWKQIIGVVPDIPQLGLEKKALPEAFFPIDYVDTPWLALVAKVSGNPLRYVNRIQQEVSKADRAAAVFLPRSMDEVVERQFVWRSLQTWIVGVFALVALTLASIGIYSVIAYSVGQRTTEIGVRLAVGASRGDILRSTVWAGVLPAVAGAAVGIACSFLFTFLTAQLLFGVGPNDASTYLSVSGMILLVAVAASYFPARRAAGLEPWKALRHE